MVKFLPILHVKIARVLQSLMGIVDGMQSASLAINAQLGSSHDFDCATQEHFFLARLFEEQRAIAITPA